LLTGDEVLGSVESADFCDYLATLDWFTHGPLGGDTEVSTAVVIASTVLRRCIPAEEKLALMLGKENMFKMCIILHGMGLQLCHNIR
jgi:hypothetical protein